MSSARPLKIVGRTRPIVQTSGFVRKEIADLMRQPRLLLVLVAGPFVLMLLFAVGYDQQQAVLRTAFVGPPDSIYERSLDRFADELKYYLTNEGYGTDRADAERRLADGEVDLVVVFPDEPVASVRSGEQALIEVVHDKIDPIQQTAVEISAQVAVQELNANVVETVVGEAQSGLVPLAETVSVADDQVARIEAGLADTDDAEVRAAAGELRATTAEMTAIASLSVAVATQLDIEGDGADLARLQELQAAIVELDAAAGRIADAGAATDPDDVRTAATAVGAVRAGAEQAVTFDPFVVVRPFASDTTTLSAHSIEVDEFFAPGAIALLLQHMALTFAALGLVSDRALGLFELFRVGPIGAAQILTGKYLAYLAIGGAVAAALVASVTFGLGVPQRGEVVWLVVGIGGLLLASIGAGMVLSLVSRSESQAVQYAMLALLAGLFFGGFFLDLEAFRYPVKAVSWALPVTYGVSLLRDVMLRGLEPSRLDLVGLAATTLVYGLLAWRLLAGRLRVR